MCQLARIYSRKHVKMMRDLRYLTRHIVELILHAAVYTFYSITHHLFFITVHISCTKHPKMYSKCVSPALPWSFLIDLLNTLFCLKIGLTKCKRFH